MTSLASSDALVYKRVIPQTQFSNLVVVGPGNTPNNQTRHFLSSFPLLTVSWLKIRGVFLANLTELEHRVVKEICRSPLPKRVKPLAAKSALAQ